MKKLKGESAILLNQALGKQGKFWQKDYYDKQIRDESHYCMTYEYIKNNALKAGLKDADKRFLRHLRGTATLALREIIGRD